ncbi:MAG: DNA-directed RNA polymerase subunit omega [Rickettsiales bacterium]|nr:DNA-directed RNA polymerase subunit omega [Rickettsiales bacterium]
MARITVEDCMKYANNRFELVLLAAQRAKDIASGAELTVNRDNDKDSVVSLREISEGTMPVETLEEAIIQGLQKPSEMDELELLESQEQERIERPSLAADLGVNLEEEEPLLEEELEEDGLDFSEENLEIED